MWGGRRVTRYAPYSQGVEELPFALAAVRVPADAVAFAEQFGLLRTPPGSPDYSEPFADWKSVATALKDAFELYGAVRVARERDDAGALDRIRAVLRARKWTTSSELRVQLDANPDALVKADILVGAILSSGIHDTRPCLQPASQVEYPTSAGVRRGEPGFFVFGPKCTTLGELAFHVAAITVAMQIDVRTCGVCSRSFVPKHGRQKYCQPSHAAVARQRRFRSGSREGQAA